MLSKYILKIQLSREKTYYYLHREVKVPNPACVLGRH